MSQEKKPVDGVFEGGGVKGIAIVGALSAMEAAGYEFVNLAGTSAGAIVASLYAAGYSAAELKPIINGLDFSSFTDSNWIGKIPLVGAVIDELAEKGLYKGDAFEKIVRDLLAQKGVHTFKDLINPKHINDADDRYHFRLRIIATDISRGSMLVLPQDIKSYGIDPENLDVALAVRMSMSIPFFFKPVSLNNSYIVDGGVLSNFPVQIFDSDGVPEWPTFGIKLALANSNNLESTVRHPINGPFSELAAILFTAIEAHDAYYLQNDKYVRTAFIDTTGVNSTDFNLKIEQKETLFNSGIKGANDFLAHWDFEKYKALYRSNQPLPSRRDMVLPM